LTAYGIGGKKEAYEFGSWTEQLEHLRTYTAKYRGIAEFDELAAAIRAGIKDYKEGHEKFNGIVSRFEKRVGELAIQIQEEQDLAANKERRRVLLPQVVAAAKAQKTKAGFGKSFTKAMKTRAQQNATLRKELFRQEKEEAAAAAAGSKLASKLAPLWKSFTARKNETRKGIAGSKASKGSKAASKASKVGLKKAAKSGSKLAEALLGAM
jgi:hypothetical protein